MSSRVTDAEVKEILDVDFDTTPFITLAHLYVDKYLKNESCFTEEMLHEMERWLAAHYACVRQRAKGDVVEERIGTAQERYQEQKMGSGFESTTYGQNAKEMDCSGLMSQSGKRKVVFETLLT